MEYIFQDNFDVLSLNTGYTVTGNKMFQGENLQAFDKNVKNAVKSKFENVDRLVCRGEQYKNMELLLDINSAIYPVRTGDKLEVVLTATLNANGSNEDESLYQHKYEGLIDQYEYVMHGTIFKMEYLDNEKASRAISSSAYSNARIAIYVSFGGLLMKLSAEQTKMCNFELDKNIYLLMKKLQ